MTTDDANKNFVFGREPEMLKARFQVENVDVEVLKQLIPLWKVFTTDKVAPAQADIHMHVLEDLDDTIVVQLDGDI